MTAPEKYIKAFIDAIVATIGSGQITALNIKVSVSANRGLTISQYSPTVNIASHPNPNRSSDFGLSFLRASFPSSSRSLQANSLTVTVVILNPSAMGITNDAITSSIKESVTSGAFTTNLEQSGAAEGAVGLKSATSDKQPVTVVVEDTGNKAPNSTDKKGLSSGAMAGVIIGALFLIGLGAGAFYMYRNAKSIKATSDNKKELQLPDVIPSFIDTKNGGSSSTVNPIFSTPNSKNALPHKPFTEL